MLQLADILLGSVIRSCYVGCADHPRIPRTGAGVKAKKDVVAYPVKEMLAKTRRGRAFQRSGHFRSFSISFFQIKDGRPHFSPVEPKDVRIDSGNLELPLWV